MADQKPPIALVRARANPPQLTAMLDEHFTVHPIPVTGDVVGALDGAAGEVRALVTATLVGADARLIGALPNLELIVCTGGHVDRIDRAAARARGIALANAPHVSAPDVADLTIALMLAVARRVCEADRFVRAGDWLDGPMPFGTRVGGKRIGIVGLGHIGRIVARRAEGFEMEICYHGHREKADAPYPYWSDLAAMADHVDFLSLHCAAIPATRNLVDGAVLKALGPRGILINAARGAVVDEAALIDALRSGAIAGAGLDVHENEPRGGEGFSDLTNVVLQPHHGAYTVEAKQTMSDMTLANLRAHFAGEALVTPVGWGLADE